MQRRTTLIFAHRLSSVIGADRILVLDEGSIVEAGDHESLMRARGAYFRLMGAQAEEGARPDTSLAVSADGGAVPREIPLEDLQLDDAGAHGAPTDAILRAEGMGWTGVFRELLRHVIPWKAKFSVVLVLGIVRVAALIGVGVAGALAVAAVKRGEPFTPYLVVLAIVAPLSGVLHWLESWCAHDMAFRMLAEMRIALFDKLDRLAPAYLVRRRTGDLVGMATHDVELVEYFFAHTVAPFLVAVLVPAAVVGTLAWFGWPMAAGPRAVSRRGGDQPLPCPAPHRRAGLAGSGGLRRHERARGGHHPGTARDPRVSAHRHAWGRVRRAHRTPHRAAAAVPCRPHEADRDPGGRHRARWARGGGDRGAPGRDRCARARDPAHADPARDVGVSARVRDRPYRPTARRHPGCDAAALRGPQRGRGG